LLKFDLIKGLEICLKICLNSTTDLIKGLEICLNSTNLTFRGKHYKQVFGTAMGSPVSSIVANLVMENIETRALETLADPPRLRKIYVDDTFVIMKRSKLSEFLTHLNTIESSIQFTMEKEREGCLPFSDLLIKRSPSGHLLSAVYRKPTHSDRYLNFRSEHPIQHKQSVVNTLLERAKKLSSTTQDLNSELKYVKRTLLLNGYPKWMIKDKKKKQYNRPPEFRSKVVLPY